MAMLSDSATRAGGAGFQRAYLVLVTLAGFLMSFSRRQWAVAIVGAVLLWYGVGNGLNWQHPSASVPPSVGPGQYVPPASPPASTVPAPAPQAGRPPTVQPVLPKALVPPPPVLITAQPIPQLEGVEAPPPAPPPPPETPFGVMRGYRPSTTPRYVTD